MTISREPASSKFLLLMLAVAMSNFMGRGSYLLLGIGLCWFLLHYYSAKVPGSVVALLIFSCVYFLFTLTRQGIVNSMQIFVCPLLWLLGYNLPEARRTQGIFGVMMVLTLGMTAHGLLNYAYNVAMDVDMYGATKLDIWTGTGRAATGQAAEFTFLIASLFYLVLVQKNRWIKILSLVAFALAMVYAILLGSRSFVVLAAITVMIGILRHFGRKDQLKRGLAVVFVLLLSALAIWIAYLRNAWGLRDYLENSYMFRRNQLGQTFSAIMEDGRFRLKRIYLSNLLTHPWGGGYIRENIAGNYAHDLWLDFFDEAGILSMLMLLVYTTLALIRILAVGADRRFHADERSALACYGITIYAQFFAEPIWQGAPMLIYAFILIDGMLARFLYTDSGVRG